MQEMAKNKAKLQPLGDRVIVEPMEQEETTASGIVLPETAKEKPQQGKVVAAGPGRVEDGKRIDMDVKAGDTVVYAKYAGTEFKMDDQKYLILSEKDILAKIA
jgi:chaperonin GroES